MRNIINIICLYLTVPIVIGILAPGQTYAFTKLPSYPKTDILMLPPVCQLIMNTPGVQGIVNQRQHTELFERPEYRLAKGNPNIHHYCYALLWKFNYFRARDKAARDYSYTNFIDNIDYVLKESDKSWPYFYVMYLEQAEMMLLKGDYAHSLEKIDQALKLKPDNEKAYALKYDVYIAMGKREPAIAAAQKGLKKNPRSPSLRRRLDKLGIKLPPLPAENRVKPAYNEPSSNLNRKPSPGGSNYDKEHEPSRNTMQSFEESPKVSDTDQKANSSSQPTTKPTAENQTPIDNDSTLNKKPWCRFCP